MKPFNSAITLIVAAIVAAPILPATAATLEQAYIAARDTAIANIKAMDKANMDTAKHSDNSAMLEAEEKARKGLEVQLRAIVGPVAIKGLEGDGAINLDTLIDGDEDFGLLDGMIFGPADAKTRVIVTTDGLFARWLHRHKDWWGEELDRHPAEPRRRSQNGCVLYASGADRCRHHAVCRASRSQAGRRGFRFRHARRAKPG